MYQFDRVISREGTQSVKYENRDCEFGEPDVMPFWIADMDFAVPPAVHNAIMKRAAHPVFGYTGTPNACYDSICNWVLKRYNWHIEPEWIEFSTGVVPLLSYAVQAFTKPGDGVVVQPPVYPPFFSVIREHERRVIENPLRETATGYVIDFENLEEITRPDDVKVLFLCNPHNPVGRVWCPSELEHIGEICLKNNVLIVSDEIHCDLTLFDNLHTPMASLSEDVAQITVTCMSPGKTFNLAGLSTAYLIASNQLLMNVMRRLMRGCHVNTASIFGTLALQTAYSLCNDWLSELKLYLENNLLQTIDYLKNNLPSVRIIKPDATFLLWLDFRSWQMSHMELKRFLVKEARLGFNDGLCFGSGGEGFMRMNIGAPWSVVQEGLFRLCEAASQLPIQQQFNSSVPQNV